ncbi:2-oxo-4-hydroxy-4-carboxy-5-ureidoimidazoline decarboxylase [Paenibacillus piscarius]|uniref:2-oxo-4-hydroxy-4-carboxy-5-ureidoimidazoline decarboxylase n=1 Tax=Paenibacillus piscarius TaxID=1089681 RepID=UPI001EE7A439|nr:2-oxo-4-hydroxy-4-carboxy-5-ureidoimidazoline decarboxylase [Paenibacillus piscarius]
MNIPAGRLTLEQINDMAEPEFVEVLGGIFEHSPWVAEGAYVKRPFSTVQQLHDAMTEVALTAEPDRQLLLLRAHPDLATRLAVSPLSAAEQQGAGLDRLAPEEFRELTELNAAYTTRFGFPFILAVRGKDKEDIISAIRERVSRSAEEERAQALREISRITRFRLEDLLGGE